jgi:hypothetical protein
MSLIDEALQGKDPFRLVQEIADKAAMQDAPVLLQGDFNEDSLSTDWRTQDSSDYEVHYMRYHPEWRRFKPGGKGEERRTIAIFDIVADDIEEDEDFEPVSIGKYKVKVAWAAELDNPGLQAKRMKTNAGDEMLVHQKVYSAKDFKRSLHLFKQVFRKLKELKNDTIRANVVRQ